MKGWLGGGGWRPATTTTLQSWVTHQAFALDLHPKLDEGEVDVAPGGLSAGLHSKGETGVHAQVVGPEDGVLRHLDGALLTQPRANA